MANPEISKVIGEQWRSLSEDEKSKWKALAEVSGTREFSPTAALGKRKYSLETDT